MKIDFKENNYKVKVTQVQSRKLQRMLFKIGYDWATSGFKVGYTEYPHLYLDIDKSISWGSNEDLFHAHKNIEVSYEQIMKVLKEQIKQNNKSKIKRSL